MLDIESDFLFDPISIDHAHIDLPEGFVERIKNWCLENGQYDKPHCFTSTYKNKLQAHHVDWIYDVIMPIAPKEQFIQSWVQVYEPCGWHPPHNHKDSIVGVSGCMYLNDGSSTHFQNPLYPDQIASNDLIKSGDILFWSPALYHFSPPVKEERIILAFNLYK